MYNLFAVFLGGGIGASLRYSVNVLFSKYSNVTIYATFFVNVIGCLILGIISGLILSKLQLPHHIKLFLTVGLMGGLTTFSTFCQEIILYLSEGKIIHSLLYLISSIVVGFFAFYVGYILFK